MFKKITLLMLSFICGSTAVQADDAAAYILGPGDVINISVYGEEDLTVVERRIDTRELIEYPYLDKVSTKGKSLNQLQEEITQGLKGRVLINPKVSVSIFKYRDFFINGVVNNPGSYEYVPGLTIEQAVAIAGGFLAKYRKTRGIYLTRFEDTKNITGDVLEEYLSDREQARISDKVAPGDTVYVVSTLFGL